MSKKKFKTLETPSGIGEIYRDDMEIAKARYKLNVRQSFIVVSTHDGEEEIPSLKEITGKISVIDGERNLIDGSVLTLHLADGRKWQFFANRGDPISGSYSAVNTSGEGLTS